MIRLKETIWGELVRPNYIKQVLIIYGSEVSFLNQFISIVIIFQGGLLLIEINSMLRLNQL